MQQKGTIALIPLVLIISAILAILAIYLGFLKNPLPNSLTNNQTITTSTSVSLKSEYQNPFDKNSQYVNPFNEYKNPFDSLK